MLQNQTHPFLRHRDWTFAHLCLVAVLDRLAVAEVDAVAVAAGVGLGSPSHSDFDQTHPFQLLTNPKRKAAMVALVAVLHLLTVDAVAIVVAADSRWNLHA